MALNFVHTDVDLRKYPDEIIPLREGDEVTLGDCHGNTLKIIYFLVKAGIMTLEKGAEDYEKLREIYEMELDLQNNDPILYWPAMQDFIAILLRAKPRSISLLRYLGDVMGDRGNNDLYTLLVYEWLIMAKIRVETLISNHDMAFISLVLNGEYSPKIALTIGYDRLANNQMRSTFGALFFLYNEIFSEERFIELFSLYRSTLKLFSYTKGAGNDLILYTHAPVGLETVFAFFNQYRDSLPDKLLTELNIPEEDGDAEACFYNLDAEQLAKVIDAVNAAFLSADILKAIDYERCYLEFFYPDGIPRRSPLECPLFRLCWNRDIEQLEAGTKVRLTLLHGHDPCSPPWGQSLDNLLGKNSRGGLISLTDPWYTRPEGGLLHLKAYRYGRLALPSDELKDLQLTYALFNPRPTPKLSRRQSIIGFFNQSKGDGITHRLQVHPEDYNFHEMK